LRKKSKNSKKLVLFFTNGISLKDWDKAGILSREIALYVELIKYDWEISFITYGDKSDLSYKKLLNGINIYCNNLGLPQKWYESLLFLIHYSVLKKCHIIKTNQMSGAIVASNVAKKFGKPLVNRMGYLLSDAVEKLPEFQHFDLKKTRKMQDEVFKQANKIVVTTNQMLKRLELNYISSIKKTSVIPNYVDINLFIPDGVSIEYDILFIGRISEQKNLISLLKATLNTEFKILIIGDGTLKNKYMTEYGNKKIKWVNTLPNNEIPFYMNRSKLFVLPSLYEGHPKILIEAMSCGMIVLASNVDGNNSIVQDKINGYLCKTDEQSIAVKIKEIFSTKEKRLKEVSTAAREYVEENFSLKRVVEMELQLYDSILMNKS